MRSALLTLFGVIGVGIEVFFSEREDQTPASVSMKPTQEATDSFSQLARSDSIPSAGLVQGMASQVQDACDQPSADTKTVTKALPEELPFPREQREWTEVFFPQVVSVNGLEKRINLDWTKNSPNADFFIPFLNDVPEVRIGSDLVSVMKEQKKPDEMLNLKEVAPELVVYPPFSGMPWRKGPDCHLNPDSAKKLVATAREIRIAFVRADENSKRIANEEERFKKFLTYFSNVAKTWKTPNVPLLAQMLEAEDAVYRMILVELLQKMDGRESTEALAKRAVFDLDERIRARAVEHLRSRPSEEYRATMLGGLRHIWQPASQNAATALTILRDTDALNDLVGLIDEPDPSLAFISTEQGNKPVVRELVRLNHNRSCAICHAAVEKTALPAKGHEIFFAVPSTKKPLPTFRSTESYQKTGEAFVRLDTTYLRQDFSVKMPCRDVNPNWEGPQRYDFITRLRPATPQETVAIGQPKPGSYPQRDLVLEVLRYLTGKDGGDSSAEWDRIVRGMQR